MPTVSNAEAYCYMGSRRGRCDFIVAEDNSRVGHVFRLHGRSVPVWMPTAALEYFENPFLAALREFVEQDCGFMRVPTTRRGLVLPRGLALAKELFLV